MPYLWQQRAQILTLQTWRGKLLKKKKKWVQDTTEQATTEKVQGKYINICLNNEKIKFQKDTGSDLTIINVEIWKKKKKKKQPWITRKK